MPWNDEWNLPAGLMGAEMYSQPLTGGLLSDAYWTSLAGNSNQGAGTAATSIGSAVAPEASGAGQGLFGITGWQSQGPLAEKPNAMAFSTPSVTGGSGPFSGSLSGTSMDYGTPEMLRGAQAAADAAPQPSWTDQAKGYAKTGMKALATYGAVNNAMGGNRQMQPPPPGRPIFTGEPPPIASSVKRDPVDPNRHALLAMFARRRQGGF